MKLIKVLISRDIPCSECYYFRVTNLFFSSHPLIKYNIRCFGAVCNHIKDHRRGTPLCCREGVCSKLRSKEEGMLGIILFGLVWGTYKWKIYFEANNNIAMNPNGLLVCVHVCLYSVTDGKWHGFQIDYFGIKEFFVAIVK